MTASNAVNSAGYDGEVAPPTADCDIARYRTGLRPMTPDGPPLIGLGRHDNLYFNTGHGHAGWTTACGSARMLADLIEGRRPEIDSTPYAPISGERRCLTTRGATEVHVINCATTYLI
jgi:D-amino-acid dehydrogenase